MAFKNQPMHFSYIYLLTNFHKDNFIPDETGNCDVIIPLTKDILERKKEYFQKLNKPSFNFCFSVPKDNKLSEQLTAEEIQNISTFFFLPNYLKKSSAYLLIADEPTGSSQPFINTAEKVLSKQGITPLSKNYINYQFANRFNEHCYYVDELIKAIVKEENETNFATLFSQVAAKKIAGKSIIIPIDNEEDYNRKIEFINNFEAWIKENETAYLDLFLAFKEMHNTYEQLESENKKLKFRMENYNDYINLLRETARWHVHEYHRIHNETQLTAQKFNEGEFRNGNNANNPPAVYYHVNELQKELDFIKSNRDNILDWYVKEYEALPIWYKRFGHVIKVMLGKRSIKSLYH